MQTPRKPRKSNQKRNSLDTAQTQFFAANSFQNSPEASQLPIPIKKKTVAGYYPYQGGSLPNEDPRLRFSTPPSSSSSTFSLTQSLQQVYPVAHPDFQNTKHQESLTADLRRMLKIGTL
jgi:hypothetical protein